MKKLKDDKRYTIINTTIIINLIVIDYKTINFFCNLNLIYIYNLAQKKIK